MTSDPVKQHILSQFGKRQMTTKSQNLAERLEELRELTARTPDDWPINLVVSRSDLPTVISALRSRDSVIEDCATREKIKQLEEKLNRLNNSFGFGPMSDAECRQRVEETEKKIAELKAALSSHAETAGVVMVPVEPTEEMLSAVWGAGINWRGFEETADDKHIADIYRAMIKAAKGGEI